MSDKLTPEQEAKNAAQIAEIVAMKKSYTACFSGKSGIEVMKDLEKKCFYNTSTLHKDPTVMGFREGQRAIVLHIKNTMNYDLERIRRIAEGQQESEG